MIKEMTFDERSYILALISDSAYLAPKKASSIFKKIGFNPSNVSFFDSHGSQAYVLHNDNDIVIVCRGTQPTEFRDIKADLKVKMVKPIIGPGKVHHGFQDSVVALWEDISNHLREIYNRQQNIWCTGHSLGAAMTVIMANVLQCDETLPNVEAVYTYGCPKPGNAEYVNAFTFAHHRWVNSADIVARVPPWPYKHKGTLHYMNHWGNVRDMSTIQMIKDRFRGFIKGLKMKNINYFANHSVSRYTENLRMNAKKLERQQTTI